MRILLYKCFVCRIQVRSWCSKWSDHCAAFRSGTFDHFQPALLHAFRKTKRCPSCRTIETNGSIPPASYCSVSWAVWPMSWEHDIMGYRAFTTIPQRISCLHDMQPADCGSLKYLISVQCTFSAFPRYCTEELAIARILAQFITVSYHRQGSQKKHFAMLYLNKDMSYMSEILWLPPRSACMFLMVIVKTDSHPTKVFARYSWPGFWPK